MKTISHLIAAIITSLIVAALIIADTIPLLPQSNVTAMFSIVIIAFPFIFAFSTILFIYWIVESNFKFAILTALIIVISTPNLLRICSFKAESNTSEGKQRTIMSYNLHFFEFDKKKATITLDYIASTKSDILCLQEIGYFTDKSGFGIDFIKARLKDYPYYYIHHVDRQKRFRKCIGVFSKYPIVSAHDVDIESYYHLATETDILIDGDTLHLINCYLESNRLNDDEKSVYEKENRKDLLHRIYMKLGMAAEKRARQASIIASESEKYGKNLIVCGDMNDVPNSPVYRIIRGKMNDPFLLHRHGYGPTFHERIYNYRIDYIFTGDGIATNGFEIDRQPFSDHYPILCDFIINKQ